MDPPFPINCLPQSENYKMIAASMAVANNLKRHGFPVPKLQLSTLALEQTYLVIRSS